MCSGRIEAKERSWQNQRKRRREGLKRKTESPSEVGDSDPVPEKKVSLGGKFSECDDVKDQAGDILQEALMQEILSSEKGQKSVSNSEVEAGEAGTGLSESLVLICDMTVRWTGSSINLDLSYLEGEAGREGVHQLCQFVKNRLASLSE